MPRLNSTGQLWCSGIAGVGLFGGDFDENDQPRVLAQMHPAGMHGFLTETEAVTQWGDSEIRAMDVRTGAWRTVAFHGASEVQADGGVWASFFRDGVRTSKAIHLPEAYIGASTGPMTSKCVGPDGQVAIKDKYHSAGPWHVYRRDGSRWKLSDGDATNIQLLGNGDRAIFRVGWNWQGIGAVAPQPMTPVVWSLAYLETEQGPWLVYQADNGKLVAHPNGRFTGFELTQGGEAFHIDAKLLPDGRYRVLWSTTEGELGTDIKVAYFRLSDPKKKLDTPAPPPPPPPPDDPKPEDPKPEEPKPVAPQLTEEAKRIIRDVWDAKIGKALEGKAQGHEAAAATSDVLFEALWHAARVDPRIGMYPKTSGTNHKGWGEDIVLIKENGKVWWKDCVVNISTLNPELHLDGFNLSDEPDKWKTPPQPTVFEPLPDPLPDPKPDTKELDALKARVKELEVLLTLQKGENTELRKEIDDWKDTHRSDLTLIESLQKELTDLKNKPHTCDCEIKPSWAARLGAKCVPRQK